MQDETWRKCLILPRSQGNCTYINMRQLLAELCWILQYSAQVTIKMCSRHENDTNHWCTNVIAVLWLSRHYLPCPLLLALSMVYQLDDRMEALQLLQNNHWTWLFYVLSIHQLLAGNLTEITLYHRNSVMLWKLKKYET